MNIHCELYGTCAIHVHVCSLGRFTNMCHFSLGRFTNSEVDKDLKRLCNEWTTSSVWHPTFSLLPSFLPPPPLLSPHPPHPFSSTSSLLPLLLFLHPTLLLSSHLLHPLQLHPLPSHCLSFSPSRVMMIWIQSCRCVGIELITALS